MLPLSLTCCKQIRLVAVALSDSNGPKNKPPIHRDVKKSDQLALLHFHFSGPVLVSVACLLQSYVKKAQITEKRAKQF